MECGGELSRAANIRFHGVLHPDSDQFKRVRRSCFAFVFPTRTRGLSAAPAAGIALGLHPVVSRESGLLLPEDVGQYLETCSFDELEQACEAALALPREVLAREAKTLFALARRRYGRDSFDASLRSFVDSLGVSCNDGQFV